MNDKFYVMNQEELLTCDGGIATALIVAYVALAGVGFTAGVTMGVSKWF